MFLQAFLLIFRGILYKNMGEPTKALKEFNKAKRL